MGAEYGWTKGVSGNPAGRKKGKSLSSTIQDMLDDEGFIDRLHDEIKIHPNVLFVTWDGPIAPVFHVQLHTNHTCPIAMQPNRIMVMM